MEATLFDRINSAIPVTTRVAIRKKAAPKTQNRRTNINKTKTSRPKQKRKNLKRGKSLKRGKTVKSKSKRKKVYRKKEKL